MSTLKTNCSNRISIVLFVFLTIVTVGYLFVRYVKYEKRSTPENVAVDRLRNEKLENFRSDSLLHSYGKHDDSEDRPNDSTPVKQFEENVKPIKIIADLSISNDVGENDEKMEYSYPYTGNFRKHNSPIWDLTPEYRFNAFGRNFHLILRLNSELTAPDLKVTYVSKNYSAHRELGINPRGCFYSGYIKGEPDSEVAVSLCDGMRGHIISQNGGYLIEPVETSTVDNWHTFLHKIWPISSERSIYINNSCSVRKDERSQSNPSAMDYSTSTTEELPSDESYRPRNKRSIDEYTIELMIVVDKNVADFHGSQLEHYILLLMNTVRSLFKSKSIGTRMNISVVNFTVLNEDESRDVKSSNNLLNEFCDWQWRQRLKNGRQHDIAIFLTRDQVCSPHENCHNVIGFAHLGTICRENGKHSCAIIRENGFLTSFTIAHELGHTLNVPHDEDSYCLSYHDDGSPAKIMTTQLSDRTEPWSWSNCSRYHLTKFLQTKNVDCLYNNPNDEFKPSTKNMLGEYYDTDTQCELAHGRGWKACNPRAIIIGEKECRKLWCYNSFEGTNCQYDGRPWADGTPCGDTINYWCKKKECKSKDHYEPIVHGGWGDWQPFSECSRSCGGGIKKSTRECNNPFPSETGEFCYGESIRYESCNTRECPAGARDFRAQQCATFNNETARWVPFTPNGNAEDRCKLACKIENVGKYHVTDDLIDGTTCDQNSYDICVDGKCMKAGCDHVLNSNRILDKCGVCGGDNSTCSEIRKDYNIEKPVYGYNFIDVIPAGSWDLDIRQYSYDNSVDSNYLALRNPEKNEYVFNGNSSVKRWAENIQYENMVLRYSGIEVNPPERVNSSNRLQKNLELEVLSVNNLSPFYIECRYKMPNALYYQWELTDEWSRCNKVCFGEQKRIIHCTRKETGNVVAYESCAGLPKPYSETRICNEYCFLRWKEESRTECSSHCGRGVTTLAYRCYQEDRNTSLMHHLPEAYCSHVEKPPETLPCIGSCDRVHWRYYEWSSCSVTCGTGVRTRQADCVDKHNQLLDESMCSRVPKRIQSPCYLEECPHWSIGEWSTCSVSCGTGHRKRTYWCEQRNKAVSKSLCPPESRPYDVETCQMAPCRARWIVGDWSQCSVSCGTGIVYRSVRCSDPNDAFCAPNEKPDETQMCYLPSCNRPEDNEIPPSDYGYSYEWRTGEWGECSTTCGKGMKQRHVECFNAKLSTPADVGQCPPSKMPHDREPCEERSCAQWKTSGWIPCSVTCGQGTTYRYVWCEMAGKRVPDSKCTESKPNTIVACDTFKTCSIAVETTSEMTEPSPASSWRTGRWGECSVLCGGGTKLRNVVCLDSKGNITSNCNEHDRPAYSSPCNTNPCPDQVKWKYGEWSQCNQTCGGGYQRRQAQCYTLKGENVPDVYCNLNENAKLIRPCANNACSKISYQWKTSSWSECSVTCGSGIHTRSVRCEKLDDYDAELRENVDVAYCDTLNRPKSEKECQRESCQADAFEYQWIHGAWNVCSVTCGQGTQSRWIHCEKVSKERRNEKELVVDSYCNETTRPKQTRKCKRGSCHSEFMWVSGPWSECRGPCGHKIKQRSTQCYHRNGKSVLNRFCVRLKRPSTKRRCKFRKCDSINCLEIKQKYNADKDQEYIISILGRNISIYCHEMSSSYPTEFLSLPAGDIENYSEFYSKRLIDPDTCPKTSHNCCVEEQSLYVGKTTFRKVRLNVTSMEIITNDYTFATINGTPVAFGEAGDCYSKQNCPQGSFGINLSGTGLQVASSVRWNRKGAYASMDVNEYNERRKIFGKCGGYCATCVPVQGLKLDVLPP